MSRNLLAVVSLTSIAALGAVSAPARADTIPSYFFSNFSIDTNCVEVGDSPSDHATSGLNFRISPATVSEDGHTYAFETLNDSSHTWNGDWAALRLAYRPGTQLSSIPADFACVPGQESSQPFLAMSGYSQTSEPQYEYEHWYGLVSINGSPHHVLIFPRNASGTSSVVIMLENATADSVQLDQDGTIHGHNY